MVFDRYLVIHKVVLEQINMIYSYENEKQRTQQKRRSYMVTVVRE